ncbi:MAG TPA: carbohydrate ABC transporter permease [Spirochaetia bacterium]|nr:carbohydrate ABC transporter permease [Spirochaetia bacterium]
MRRKTYSALFIKYLLIVVLVFIFLFPIYALILASFRPGRDLMRFGITFASLIPKNLDVKNFIGLIRDRDGIYLTWYKNSILLAALQTTLCLILSSFVGFGLGAYRFKGRNTISILVLFLMMIPLQILILPLFQLMIGLRLINTYPGIMLPFIVSPFVIFFFRQYSLGIPGDYFDAGRIDGLNEYSIFFRIAIPLMSPAFAAMAILVAQQSWNNFLWPLIVLRTGDMFTLPIGLNTLLTPYGNNYDMLIAGSCVASLPLFIVFFLFQKYFISGLVSGGIKG